MNQAINFFWTIICWAPVLAYWYQRGPVAVCWVFAGVSLAAMIIPSRWLQLSRDADFYRRRGARFIRKFVQNGDHARSSGKIITNKTTARQYANTVLMYEKFHLMCLVFFLLTDMHAVWLRRYGLAGLILAANVIYNVCPILLQQYNRARLMRMVR